MNAVLYLYRTSFRNKFKKAIRKPITYVYLFLILIYVVFLPFSLRILLQQYHFDTPEGMVLVVTIASFFLIPASLASYVNRKGLLFKKGDVHLLFPTPVSPKQILIYAHIKTLGINILVYLIVSVVGCFMFRISLLQITLYFLANMVLEMMLETAFMILSYGSEGLTEGMRRGIKYVCYGVIGCFFVIAFVMYLQRGLSLESAVDYLNSAAIQMVPVAGWFIALMHLIFTGPTTVNVICSILYLVVVILCTVAALKMPCTGDFYEDAEKFAEDYEELLEKKRSGEMGSFGKREKYGKANVAYKGSGAKSIFYKQLLEYKKNMGTFFDKTTLMMVAIGIFLCYSLSMDKDNAIYLQFLMPGIMAYIVFCCTAITGKWGKEIKNPYTFLIPDSSFRKLWYATLLEHAKALMVGLLIAIPCMFITKTPFLQTVLCVILYMLLNASKLYVLVMAEVLVGNVLGRVGKQFFQMLIQGIVISFAVLGAIIGTVLVSIELGYLLMAVIMLGITLLFMLIASLTFERMETA